MASVQDRPPVISEHPERPGHPEQSLPTQPTPRTTEDPSESPTSEPPRDPSPPRPSQLIEGSEAYASRRGTSGTDRRVNHPSIITSPTNAAGPVSNIGGIPTASSDRSQTHFTSVAPDRRLLPLHEPIREETPFQVELPDDALARRASNLPRPQPAFSPVEGGLGNLIGSRRVFRGDSAPNSDPDLRKSHQPKSVEERLDDTLSSAEAERDKYEKKAQLQKLLLNGTIGLQVIVGAITTGVAAGGKNVGTAVAGLGGVSTALASYLASVRGSGEPEYSTIRARELNTFIREVRAFVLDHGHVTGPEHDIQIIMFRERFELIIKTDGEDSTSGTSYSSQSRGHPWMTGNLANPQSMSMIKWQQGGNGHSEKHMWKNEKAIGEMV